MVPRQDVLGDMHNSFSETGMVSLFQQKRSFHVDFSVKNVNKTVVKYGCVQIY